MVVFLGGEDFYFWEDFLNVIYFTRNFFNLYLYNRVKAH
jgi:hypothetical protein